MSNNPGFPLPVPYIQLQFLNLAFKIIHNLALKDTFLILIFHLYSQTDFFKKTVPFKCFVLFNF